MKTRTLFTPNSKSAIGSSGMGDSPMCWRSALFYASNPTGESPVPLNPPNAALTLKLTLTLALIVIVTCFPARAFSQSAPATPPAQTPAPAQPPPAPSQPPPAAEPLEMPKSKFFDNDGWFDVSGFLATAYGFVPLIVPITEPAVGYGVVGGPVFIKRNPRAADGSFVRPDMSVVGGAWTENDTKALFAANSAAWLDGKLQTLVGGVYGDVHLEFHGLGTDQLAAPVDYSIRIYGGGVRATYQLGKSNWRAGLGYMYMNTKVSLEHGPDFPDNIPQQDLDTTLAGISPTIVYDSRDNIFTPGKGLYAEATVPVHGSAFGGDADYQLVQLTLLAFHPVLEDKLYAGIKVAGQGSYGDTPFYTRPYVDLRGAEAMRYSGQYVAETEVELRWQFTKRFSLVGFAGYGYTDYDIGGFKKNNHVTTGGVGVRYMIARIFGLHMGFDVAWGPDSPIFYIDFGSAWMRP